MNIPLIEGWSILQDVHDIGERCQIFQVDYNNVSTSSQFSEWEPIDYLGHLQPYFSDKPYFGRELRYFNSAPWWYKKVFVIPDNNQFDCASIQFEGVDYYCRIWINGIFAGEHEGYGTPFELQVDKLLHVGSNTVVVKVWSPWDHTVLRGMEDRRVFHVVRTMMKGTYEHDDTLIQRDVNPVGIYGDVTVVLRKSARIIGKPKIFYTTMHGKAMCGLRIASSVESNATLLTSIFEKESGAAVVSLSKPMQLIIGDNDVNFEFEVNNNGIWNTWDRGGPCLYEARFELSLNSSVLDSGQVTFGFRDISMIRNDQETTYLLNGRRIFLRGTCYMPEVYLSEMNRERYKRDMDLVKALGFNAIRVHVHTAKSCLYDICDQLGIAVIQDSDFNWTHDDSNEFAQRSATIFREVIDHLRSHPSVISWICMNEPDFIKSRQHVDGNPGPQLWDAVCEEDPWRPAIKASYLGDDPNSGDTHLYFGSLEDETSLYTDIDHTVEKLNTEFGIDAPPSKINLRKVKEVWGRLKPIESEIESIQYYQYRLIKYYIEHYRTSKFNACSGYFQFMLNDLCPQSYYGIYDWWGIPKKSVDAFGESNMPVAVFMKKQEKGFEIILVNDTEHSYEDLHVSWSIVGTAGDMVVSGKVQVDMNVDSMQKVAQLSDEHILPGGHYRALLTVTNRSGEVIAKNVYDNFLYHPHRPVGHPRRMSHELGARLFHA